MKTKMILAITILSLISLLILSGCETRTTIGSNPTNISLYNETLNKELDNLTNPANVVDISNTTFKEFIFNYTLRPEAEYEFAKDDVFNLSNGTLNSSQLSVLGVMLGDNYSVVLQMLGVPDVMNIASDNSYRNMEYGKKIGIGGNTTALTMHLENDTVTRISMRRPFAKYTRGNTSYALGKDYIYRTFDTPDYQDFTSNLKVFHYVTQGLELYLKADRIDVISIIPPMQFKGVTYVTVREQIGNGVYVNVTKAVLNK